MSERLLICEMRKREKLDDAKKIAVRNRNEGSRGSAEIDHRWTKISSGLRLDLRVLHVAEKVIIRE